MQQIYEENNIQKVYNYIGAIVEDSLVVLIQDVDRPNAIKDGLDIPLNEIEGIYETIKLPKRATEFSAGYDFFTHIPFDLEPNQTIKIPTGIRCIMENDWVLKLYPRSGLGFKYRLELDNTVGIVDNDYFESDN